MEEKIFNLIKSRGPWFLKNNILSKAIFNFLSKYLRIKESIYVGDTFKVCREQRLLLG